MCVCADQVWLSGGNPCRIVRICMAFHPCEYVCAIFVLTNRQIGALGDSYNKLVTNISVLRVSNGKFGLPDSILSVGGRSADSKCIRMASHWYGCVNVVLNAIVGGSVYRIRSTDMAGTLCGCSRAEAMCFFAWIPFGIWDSEHTMACQHFVLVAKHPTCLFGPVSIQIATNSNCRRELSDCCLWHL